MMRKREAGYQVQLQWWNLKKLYKVEIYKLYNTWGEITWLNNRMGSERIISMIERDFVNEKWENLHQDWRVRILPTLGSNYVPMFGSCFSVPKPSNIPFKFFSGWIVHNAFNETVSNSWKQSMEGLPMLKLMHKLQRLKKY